MDYDVIIVGAGISGINATYRLREAHPSRSFTILESRSELGGTWSFFKYPGLRSDNDMYTYCFQWNPWPERDNVADGESIHRYLRDSARKAGIDKKIRYEHKLVKAEWSADTASWTLSVSHGSEAKVFTSGWVIFATGMFDYDKAQETELPGIERFEGPVVQSQFWPSDLDYEGKNIVLVGSGSTAVSMMPTLAEKASHLTFLQRSPTYYAPVPRYDKVALFIRALLPAFIADLLIRVRNSLWSYLFVKYCRMYPQAGRRLLQDGAKKMLPANASFDPHFTPYYEPWDQRLCFCVDEDFFEAIRNGKASMATGRIKNVTEREIEVEGQDGGKTETLKPDMIVTATGLRYLLCGNVELIVNSKPVALKDKYLWQGTLIQDVPNAGILFGYTNAAWTPGTDANLGLMTRIMQQIDRQGKTYVVPTVQGEVGDVPLYTIISTWIVNAKNRMPKGGDRGPWRPRVSYVFDYWISRYGSIQDGLVYR